MAPGFQLWSSLRCHSQHDVFLLLPEVVLLLSSWLSNIPQNFGTTFTSTGNSHKLQPLLLKSAMRSAYFRLFPSWATSQFSSHGILSYITSNVFVSIQDRTMSDRIVVSTILGKISLLLKSTCSSHCVPLSNNEDGKTALLSLTLSPYFTNCIIFPPAYGFSLLFSFFSTSANSKTTLSCPQLYLPCVRAFWHPDRV